MRINDPYWQSSGILIFLCKYYIVTSDTLVGFFLDGLYLLFTVILSELYEKPRRNKDWVTEKSTQKNLCGSITFLTAHHPFYVIFCCFLRLLPFPSWRTSWMAPIKIHNISMGGILCDVENVKKSCNLIQLLGISKNLMLS